MSAPGCAPREVIRDYWLAALKLYAAGRAADDVRAQAANPETVRARAAYGVTEEEGRARALAVADCIDRLSAAGLTPAECWYLAGMDRLHGPFPGATAEATAA